MDPKKLADALGSNADISGILPVHVYGYVCDVESIEKLGTDAALPVIYDAAQCFGSEYKGRSAVDYGNFAACSFHATKVFHTGEGGAVVVHSEDHLRAIQLLRACGHIDDTHIRLGTNAKLSEFHAAIGLCLLDKVAGNITALKAVSSAYDTLLCAHGVQRPKLRPGLMYNYAYYPVIFDSEDILLRVVKALRKENIFPRRYFYPALNTLPYLPLRDQVCPVAESISHRALCLPLHVELEENDVRKIVAIINSIV